MSRPVVKRDPPSKKFLGSSTARGFFGTSTAATREPISTRFATRGCAVTSKSDADGAAGRARVEGGRHVSPGERVAQRHPSRGLCRASGSNGGKPIDLHRTRVERRALAVCGRCPSTPRRRRAASPTALTTKIDRFSPVATGRFRRPAVAGADRYDLVTPRLRRYVRCCVKSIASCRRRTIRTMPPSATT
jgi:hypothetical protein